MLAAILSILFFGFAIGALARWAVPGPDPMPAWLTVLIGLAGAAIGGSVAGSIFGARNTPHDFFAVAIGSIVASALIVVAYRRLVQKRPITGPEAYKLPTRGVGVARLRRRLQQLGLDPDAFPERRPPPEPDDTSEELRRLVQLRDEGLLTEEEFERRKAELLGRE